MIKKIRGKSKLFVRCHKSLLMAKSAINEDDISHARKLYLKSLHMYGKMDYHDKKDIHNELRNIYQNLKKHESFKIMG